MGKRKKIAVLLGQAEENYQEQFLTGFFSVALVQNYDVCVFSMYQKYQESSGREIGESNIFNLVPYDSMDCVVVLNDCIQTPGVIERVEDQIKAEFHGPVICIDKESKYFPTIMTDHYYPVKKLISHLIEVHHYTDIAFLTGKEWHIHSKIRLQAFRDCMKEHHLEVNENRIFYGDFWYTSGENMADRLANDRDNLPQAIACANDCMAIGVAKSLTSHGIRVPEDVAVIGYDAIEEGRRSPVPLTSAPIPAKECGIHAAKSIIALLNGEEMTEFKTNVDLFIGGSCGCSYCEEMQKIKRRTTWETAISSAGFNSLYNHMMDDLLGQMTFEDLIRTIYSYVHQIRPFQDFYLCLNEAWRHPEQMALDTIATEQFSDEMIQALHCCKEGENQDRVDFSLLINRHDLLSDLNQDREEAKAFIFTPLCFEQRSFGYAVISYSEPKSYDETYVLWLRNLMHGMECFRRVEVLQQMNQMLQSSQIRDSLTGLYNYRGFLGQAETLLEGNVTCYGILSVDMKGLTYINDNFGRDAGNHAIQKVVKCMEVAFPNGTSCCLGNGEFFIAQALPDGNQEIFLNEKNALLELLAEENKGDNGYCLEIYTGEKFADVINLSDLEDLISNAVSQKNGNKVSEQKLNRRGDLTAEERLEAQIVNQLLDENRFLYQFQPIVSAKTGNIYAYEALMRADVTPYLSPLKVLKYAEYFERLYDVEKATFFNVLERIENNSEFNNGRKVFINSIPGNRLIGEDEVKLEDILKRHADTVVVELTEQTELSDEALNDMKKSYAKLGIETAVDDYGTGYSNVTNLIRYMPNYVKIDRMLLSEIQNSPQKQHFVKDIIEFAHDNKIMALAEGVETTDELRTVIELGVDLIQGYYTARPSYEIAEAIAEDIQNEIIRYNEIAHGIVRRKVYRAGKDNRVSVTKLISEHYGTIEVVKDKSVYRDITIVGIPGEEADLNIRIRDGYHGRIELENVYLQKDKKNSCIKIGNDCDVTLVFKGESNIFKTDIFTESGSVVFFERIAND
ncbi:MAG: EAL domain-containing protein [Lachnospiraceae bacterium]